MAEAFDEIEAAYQHVGRDLFASDRLRQDLAERDPDEAAFFTLVLVGAEIDNGGFSQLFTNTTGDLIEEAIVGAERFGLDDHARLLQDASETLFPGGVPLDHEARLRAWDELLGDSDDPALDAQIEALDERWYALADVLEQKLHGYARAHPPS